MVLSGFKTEFERQTIKVFKTFRKTIEILTSDQENMV